MEKHVVLTMTADTNGSPRNAVKTQAFREDATFGALMEISVKKHKLVQTMSCSDTSLVLLIKNLIALLPLSKLMQ
jgi:ABC-type molybdenum transport system ATPase subunit/photorepair protein PhrA